MVLYRFNNYGYFRVLVGGGVMSIEEQFELYKVIHKEIDCEVCDAVGS